MKKFLQYSSMLVVLFLMVNQLNAQTILCVDRDGSGYSPDVFSDTWHKIKYSLDANGLTYDYIEILNPDTTLGGDILDAGLYDIVFWFTGETWEQNQTMSAEEEFNLILYMAFGGKLFLNSQDYLYDRYNGYGTFSDTEFPYSQLGVVEVSQDVLNIEEGEVDSARFVGSPGSIAEGLEFPVLDIFTEPTDDGLWVDSIAEHNGQDMMGILVPYVSPGPFAIQYETESFRSVFTTVEIASITDTVARDILMGRIMEWLMYGMIGIDDEKEIDQSQLIIRPNPVRDYVNMGTNKPMEEIQIYNNQGQLVYNSEINSRSTKIDLGHLTTGMYIVKVKTGTGYITEKLIKQ